MSRYEHYTEQELIDQDIEDEGGDEKQDTDSDDGPWICPSCRGSGEGPVGEPVCHRCRGRGEI